MASISLSRWPRRHTRLVAALLSILAAGIGLAILGQLATASAAPSPTRIYDYDVPSASTTPLINYRGGAAAVIPRPTGIGAWTPHVAATVVAAEDTAGVAFRSDTSHIFRDAAGHLAGDSPENRAILQDTVNPENFVGTRGPNGSISVDRRLLPDGQQAWVEVRNGTEITNGGVNPVPR